MNLGVAQTLAASSGANDVSGLKKLAADSNPAAMRKVAQQFGALMMQNLMRQNDGTALPMATGAGSDVVNQMFAGTIGQAVMSHDKTGLTDLLLHSLQKKQQQANGGDTAGASGPANPVTAATASSLAKIGAAGAGFPLAAYWQGNGTRPLAAAIAQGIAQGGASPNAGAALAMMTHINPKLAFAFGAGAATAAAPSAAGAGSTTFQSKPGHASGGVSPEEATAFAQKLMPLLQKAGQQLGVSPKILLAQAAIETGWGRSVVGNNLFGIKAGSSWSGQKVDAATHEYENGQLISITDAFRAYPNAEASVADMASLIGNSSRYKAAVGAGDNAAAYAQGLLAGGWATDIDYVRKLQAVASSPTLAAAVASLPTPPSSPTPPASAVGQPVSLLPAGFTVAAK